MKCPECDSLNDFVVDSRMDREGAVVRRRRRCRRCGGRWTTYEIMPPGKTRMLAIDIERFKGDLLAQLIGTIEKAVNIAVKSPNRARKGIERV